MLVTDLHKLINYDPTTGKFTWKLGRVGASFGSEAGYTNPRGYRVIKIGTHPYLAHRLAFFLMKGYWPDQIDHKNGVKDDNRWENLREVSSSLNTHNKPSNRGISKLKSGKYKARIMFEGVEYFLGHHDTHEQAMKARLAAEERFGIEVLYAAD